MVNYYLNLHAQQNGDHEIHKETCPYYYNFKTGYNFAFLGAFSSDYDAMNCAKRRYPLLRIDGCVYCCAAIHKH